MTSDSELIRFAAALGETMLVSGAETYRVEDTIERILSVGLCYHNGHICMYKAGRRYTPYGSKARKGQKHQP